MKQTVELCVHGGRGASRSQGKQKTSHLELLLELTIEAGQHCVGFFVLTDRHLDLPLLSGQSENHVLLHYLYR